MCTKRERVVCRRSEGDLRGETKDHAPKHDDNRRLCICDKAEPLPYHETRSEDRSKVEDLEEDLWRIGVGWLMRTSDTEKGTTHMTKAKPSKCFELF